MVEKSNFCSSLNKLFSELQISYLPSEIKEKQNSAFKQCSGKQNLNVLIFKHYKLFP